MKILRIVFFLILLLTTILFTLVSCVTPHNVVFMNDACLRPDKKYDYNTCSSLHVRIDGKNYVIPENFKTDLASIPRPLWSFIAPQYTGFIAPSILHDYLYRSDALVTRKYADEILYYALLSNGVTRYTSIKFYVAVRLFGASHFNHR